MEELTAFNQANKISSTTLSAIKQNIRYTETAPSVLSKFYDFKSLLFGEIMKNPESFNLEQLEEGKLTKAYSVLEKKYLGDYEFIDNSKNEANFDSMVATVLSNFKLTSDKFSPDENANNQVVSIKEEKGTFDLFLAVPRGMRLTLHNVRASEGFEVVAQNTFNIYPGEGFTAAFRFEDVMISFEPASTTGMKGAGELYVYVWLKNGIIIKDNAAKYLDVTTLMSQFRG